MARGEKLAKDTMKPRKMKRHQETKHQEIAGEGQDFFLRGRSSWNYQKDPWTSEKLLKEQALICTGGIV